MCTGFHSEATSPNSKCHVNFSKLILSGKLMRNVNLNIEYVILFRNSRDKSQCGHLARQLEPKHSKAFVDATSRPYSHLLVDLKPHTPDAQRYRSNSLQLDRQRMYVIGAVPTCEARMPTWSPHDPLRVCVGLSVENIR